MTLNEAIAHYANKVDIKIGWLRSAVLNGDSNEAQAILNDIKEDASRLIWLKDLEQQEVEECSTAQSKSLTLRTVRDAG